MSSVLAKLKSDLQLKHGLKLIDAENLKSSPGVGTGWNALDSFVASGGFPCGEISLVEASEGIGATTLWLDAAAKLTANHSRVAWLNSASDDREPFQLHPPTALQRGIDLQKLFLVDVPSGRTNLRAWTLQELLNSKLFSLVGCDLGDVHIPLRECRSLLMQARRSGAAVVLFDRRSAGLSRESSALAGARTSASASGLFRSGSACAGARTSASASGFPPAARTLASLVLKFDQSGIEIVRAAHRPVPQHLQRRDRHVEFITGSRTPALEPRRYMLDPSFILANSCADD